MWAIFNACLYIVPLLLITYVGLGNEEHSHWLVAVSDTAIFKDMHTPSGQAHFASSVFFRIGVDTGYCKEEVKA